MAGKNSAPKLPRVARRQANVKLARHYREQEHKTHKEIAELLGVSPATVKTYFWDPDGSKQRARKQRYRGTCQECGGPTSSPEGPGRARRLCRRCQRASERVWEKEDIVKAWLDWEAMYGKEPTSTDWSMSYARRRGGEALKRLQRGHWPPASVATDRFVHWEKLREAARRATAVGAA